MHLPKWERDQTSVPAGHAGGRRLSELRVGTSWVEGLLEQLRIERPRCGGRLNLTRDFQSGLVWLGRGALASV